MPRAPDAVRGVQGGLHGDARVAHPLLSKHTDARPHTWKHAAGFIAGFMAVFMAESRDAARDARGSAARGPGLREACRA